MPDVSAQTTPTTPAGAPGVRRIENLPLDGRSLRQHTARGTLINAAFSVGLAVLGVSRRFLVAIFLTAADYGVWGLIFTAVATLLWLKDIGIGDKYIQQDEADQELAFQKAFTINFVWTLVFCVVVLVGVPFFSLIYGRPEIILPGCLMSLGVLASAFQAPMWIFYRQLRFARQRALQSIEPVVGFVVTMALAAAGAGYWSLVIGLVSGTSAAAIASLIACPYPLRWRFERRALRDYYSFSWPLVVASGSSLIVVQVAVILGESTVGLAGVGAIGLSSAIIAFADRADAIVTQTLYPAICAVRERVDLLAEAFTKSNRLALIWGMPFGLALALFSPDLVHYVLGAKWEVATGLLQVFGVTCAVKQIAFNWTAFHRAVNQTRPIAANSIAALATFMVVGVPGMLMWGLTGYAIAIGAMSAVQLAVRGYYLSRLFSGFNIVWHSARAIAPSIPPVLVVLGLRLLESGERSGELVLTELSLYVILTALATWALERPLLLEVLGYARGRARATQPA